MTREATVEKAKAVAEAEAWPWYEPIDVRRYRRWWFGKAYWEVFTNQGSRGCNVRIEIDDATGKVVLKSFNPR